MSQLDKLDEILEHIRLVELVKLIEIGVENKQSEDYIYILIREHGFTEYTTIMIARIKLEKHHEYKRYEGKEIYKNIDH